MTRNHHPKHPLAVTSSPGSLKFLVLALLLTIGGLYAIEKWWPAPSATQARYALNLPPNVLREDIDEWAQQQGFVILRRENERRYIVQGPANAETSKAQIAALLKCLPKAQLSPSKDAATNTGTRAEAVHNGTPQQ